MAIRYSHKNALLHHEIEKLSEELKKASSSELVELLYKSSWTKTKRHSDLMLVKEMPAFKAAALILELKGDRLNVWNAALDMAARVCANMSVRQKSEDQAKVLASAREEILLFKEQPALPELGPLASKDSVDPEK